MPRAPMSDRILQMLAQERRDIMVELGQAMRMAGGSSANRAAVNKKKRVQQNQLRRRIDSNARQIVTRVMDLFGVTS